MKFKYIQLVLILSSLLLSANYVNAQVKHRKIAKIKLTNKVLPFDPAVRTGKLPNGFTYFIRHNEEPKNRVLMYLVNKVGSVLENEDQRGLAHFMEHMNFNGTTHFAHNELINYLQKIGVRFGADLNAYTGFDETVYQLPIPTDKPELVASGLEVMHDWAHGATLDPVEIDKERGIVLEEKRLGKGAQERMGRIYYPVILNNSRYASRLPIGTDEVLNNFKPATIKQFYHDWYRPDLQALVVVGDIKVDQIEKEIKSKFADLKNPVTERPRVDYKIPLTGKNQFLAVTDKEMPYTVAQVMIKQQGAPIKTEAQFKNSIMDQLFYLTMRERINELSQVANPPFLNASVSIGDFLAGLKNFNVTVTANPGGLESGFKTIWREVKRIKTYGVTATELARVKLRYMKSLEESLAEKDKTSSENYVKEYVQYFLKETASPGIDFEYILSKRLIDAISIQDLNSLVNQSIQDINRDILVMAPEKEKSKLPDQATFLSWMKSVDQENVTPYQDNTSNLSLLKIQPKPGKIVKSVRDEKLDITTLILSNGARVILKKTNFQNDEIIIDGVASGGNSLYPDSLFRSAFAANYVPFYGVGNYNASQLRKYLAGREAVPAFAIDERTEQFETRTKRKDLEIALEIIYAQITEPRLDLEQFKGVISSQIAAMANKDDDPNSVFMDTVIAAQHPNKSPRRIRATAADLKTIDPAKSLEIFKERWSDASGLTITIVGSIDTVSIKPLIEKYFASLPSTYKNEQAKILSLNPVHGTAERIVYKGQAPRAAVQLVFTGDFDYNLKDNLTLEAMNSVLSIEITERLRENESGAYSPQIYAGGTSKNGGWYNIIVQFNCAPENVDKLIDAANDEIKKVVKSGPTEIDLEKFKIEFKRQKELRLQNNGYWSSYFKKQLIENADLEEVLNQDRVIDAITVEDVKKIANKYFNYQNYSKFVLMPDKNSNNK